MKCLKFVLQALQITHALMQIASLAHVKLRDLLVAAAAFFKVTANFVAAHDLNLQLPVFCFLYQFYGFEFRGSVPL